MATEPLKILLLPSWYPEHSDDYSGSFFREQAIALSQLGCSVAVLAVNLRARYAVTLFPRLFLGPEIIDDEGVLTFRIRAVNWLFFCPRLRDRFHCFLFKRLFSMYVKRCGLPSLVHVHSILPAGLLAHELWSRRQIPYVVTEHSSRYALQPTSPHLLAQARLIASGARAKWAVSSSLASLLQQRIPADQGSWQVMPNLVTASFLTQPLVQAQADQFIFINICIHTSNKHVDLLLRAFSKAFLGRQSVLLHLGGQGPETSRLRSLAQQLGIADQVVFLGSLQRQAVQQALSKANVFVLTSQYETFGVVLIEALAMGLPVISTRCGGPLDIVNPANGLLVDVDNPDQLSQAMQAVYETFERYDAHSLRSDCKIRFGAESVARKLVAAYTSALTSVSCLSSE